MLARFLSHVGRLWGPWWPLPTLFFAGYAAIMAAIGDLRVEHVALVVVVAAFAYTGPRSKQFLLDMTPFILLGLGYDLVRYARSALVSADRVMSCSLQHADRLLFPVGGGSVQEWLAAHPLPALDLLFAVPYAIFVYVGLVYAGYLFFVDRPRMRRYLWALAIGNYISFAAWLIVPAAPPWYIHAHGCQVDMAVAPSAAGLLRVDEMLHIHYFQSFYSRAASAFGAMPSMHNAYPLIGLFTAWSSIGWKTRPIHIVYFLCMFVASLYLDHHWVVDAIAGWITAGVAVFLAPLAVKAWAPSRQLVPAPVEVTEAAQ